MSFGNPRGYGRTPPAVGAASGVLGFLQNFFQARQQQAALRLSQLIQTHALRREDQQDAFTRQQYADSQARQKTLDERNTVTGFPEAHGAIPGSAPSPDVGGGAAGFLPLGPASGFPAQPAGLGRPRWLIALQQAHDDAAAKQKATADQEAGKEQGRADRSVLGAKTRILAAVLNNDTRTANTIHAARARTAVSLINQGADEMAAWAEANRLHPGGTPTDPERLFRAAGLNDQAGLQGAAGGASPSPAAGPDGPPSLSQLGQTNGPGPPTGFRGPIGGPVDTGTALPWMPPDNAGIDTPATGLGTLARLFPLDASPVPNPAPGTAPAGASPLFPGGTVAAARIGALQATAGAARARTERTTTLLPLEKNILTARVDDLKERTKNLPAQRALHVWGLKLQQRGLSQRDRSIALQEWRGQADVALRGYQAETARMATDQRLTPDQAADVRALQSELSSTLGEVRAMDAAGMKAQTAGDDPTPYFDRLKELTADVDYYRQQLGTAAKPTRAPSAGPQVPPYPGAGGGAAINPGERRQISVGGVSQTVTYGDLVASLRRHPAYAARAEQKARALWNSGQATR